MPSGDRLEELLTAAEDECLSALVGEESDS